MLEPKTFDWSDSRSDTGYETQLENLKKISTSVDTTKQYSENASTSEEGSSVASPFISSSSKFSSHHKSIREKIDQIRNLYGPVVYLNVFDLTADITGADFIQFYDPIRIDSIIKYPTSTMLDLEFCCKEDAIRAIEKGVGMINGCLFSVRVSKRNYNPNASRQNERFSTYYNKKDFGLVTYTKKAEVPEKKVEEVAAPSLQTITENNLEDALHKILSIEISEAEESSVSQQEAVAKTFDVITNVSLTNSPQISMQSDLIKSVSMNLTSPQPKKTLGKEMRTPPMKVGKYRNIVRSENKTQSTASSAYQPSAEEMEKVNKLQKQLIDQFLQEKQALERLQKEKEENERIQKEKEENERIQRENEEARLRAIEEEKQRAEEEERVRAEEKAKEEEEASKPVRKEVYEKVIYQQTTWRDDRYYRDDGYYRGSSRYGGYGNGYDNYNSRYSSRPSAYRFATVEKEYTPRKNF